MTIFKVAKFIENKGLETIGILAVLAVLFSGWIFYSYAWSSVDSSEGLEFDGLILKENALESTIQDLEKKEAVLKGLDSSPLFSGNIFD